MGKVILTLTNAFGQNSTASFRCKDEDAAQKIADRRPNCTDHKFYNDGERIPKTVKTKVPEKSFEEQVEELAKKTGMSIDAKDVR